MSQYWPKAAMQSVEENSTAFIDYGSLRIHNEN